LKKLTPADLKSLDEYEKIRPIQRRQIIELKQIRRVAVGDNISIVFENRDTMLWQTQEMLRAEHISDPAAIQEELDTYNDLVPGANELRATLFIELPDQDNIPRDLPRFIGVEETISLTFAGHTVDAEAEPGRSTEEKTATVHYLRFPFTPAEAAAFAVPAALFADHPNYQAKSELAEATVASLKEDLIAN
jgi:hypothetical protein